MKVFCEFEKECYSGEIIGTYGISEEIDDMYGLEDILVTYIVIMCDDGVIRTFNSEHVKREE